MASPYQKLEEPINAGSQRDYQSQIEDRACQFVNPYSPLEELAKGLSKLIGAEIWAQVSAQHGNQMIVKAESSASAVNWGDAAADIMGNLNEGTERSFLITRPRNWGQFSVEAGMIVNRGNLLVCRLSSIPEDEEWHEAVVFANPVDKHYGSAGTWPSLLISRVFKAIEERIDCHVYWRKRQSSTTLPFDSVEILTHRLAEMLGSEVELTSTSTGIVVSRISNVSGLGNYNEQHLAEICTEILFGGRILEQTFLGTSRRYRAPEGNVIEFPIDVYGYPVHERSVLVTQGAFGGECQVVIPKGWWWYTKPELPMVTVEAAIATALASEKQSHPQDLELTAEWEATVIWPDGPPGRLSHLVTIASNVSLCPLYVIDCNDGSIVERKNTVRS